MDTNLLSSALLPPAEDPKPKKPVVVDNKVRQDWNNYLDFLSSKGLQGHPSLDKGDNGNRMIDLYRKENPNTSLSRDMVTPIQQEFSKYRDSMIQNLRDKKAMISDASAPGGRFVKPDENLDNYMSSLSKVDGIAGSMTTSHKYPISMLKTIEADGKTTVQDKGFANTNSVASIYK